jgi:hypothetical protein
MGKTRPPYPRELPGRSDPEMILAQHFACPCINSSGKPNLVVLFMVGFCFSRIAMSYENTPRLGFGMTNDPARAANDLTPCAIASSNFDCGTNKYRHRPYAVRLIFSHLSGGRSRFERRIGPDLPLVSASHVSSRPSASRAATMKSG